MIGVREAARMSWEWYRIRPTQMPRWKALWMCVRWFFMIRKVY